MPGEIRSRALGDIAVGENVWEVHGGLAGPLPLDTKCYDMAETSRPQGIRLRSQLITNAVLGVVLPLVLLGGIAFFFLTYHLEIVEASFARSRAALTDNIVRTDLMAQTSGVARQIDAFLIERIVEVKAWAAAPIVVEAARAAHARHVADGLTEASADAVENRFRIDKSLNISPKADAYLRSQIAASPYFAEVFFTDRNGFNVALTNPTSDFIQSDESWWQNAWSRGISVGEVQYDDSAGVWSIDISIRIDGRDTGKSLGVMKTVLAIEPIQRIADWTSQTIPNGRVQISTGGGSLIAETSSSHARERIMNPDVNISEQGDEPERAAFGAERAGFGIGQEWVTSFARTGGYDTYASTIDKFPGFDWIVILQKPLAGVVEPISALRSVEEAMRGWRWILAFTLAVIAVLGGIVSLVVAAGVARRYTASLNEVRDLAERAAQGQMTSPAVIESPEEIAQLNDAVSRLGRAFMSVLERHRHYR